MQKHGIVASQEALASKVGLEILKQGSNAVDLALAISCHSYQEQVILVVNLC